MAPEPDGILDPNQFRNSLCATAALRLASRSTLRWIREMDLQWLLFGRRSQA